LVIFSLVPSSPIRIEIPLFLGRMLDSPSLRFLRPGSCYEAGAPTQPSFPQETRLFFPPEVKGRSGLPPRPQPNFTAPARRPPFAKAALLPFFPYHKAVVTLPNKTMESSPPVFSFFPAPSRACTPLFFSCSTHAPPSVSLRRECPP